jgi:hypothetical protein
MANLVDIPNAHINSFNISGIVINNISFHNPLLFLNGALYIDFTNAFLFKNNKNIKNVTDLEIKVP